MKKSIWIFLLAVLLPSIVLGVLALRSVEEQQIILEKQTAKLYQTETEYAASATRALIDAERRAFNQTVRRLLDTEGPQKLANDFNASLSKEWSRKSIGFAIGTQGQLCSPTPQNARLDADLGKFLLGNGGWLAGNTTATVYWTSPEELVRPEPLRKGGSRAGAWDLNNTISSGSNTYGRSNTDDNNKRNQTDGQQQQLQLNPGAQSGDNLQFNAPPPNAQFNQQQERQSKPAGKTIVITTDNNLSKEPPPKQQVQVQPQPQPQQQGPQQAAQPALEQQGYNNNNDAQVWANNKNDPANRTVAPLNNGVALSQLTPATANFRALTSDTTEGVITRFVQDQLDIIFWLRPAQADNMVFACLISADDLRDLWPLALPIQVREDSSRSSRSEKPMFILALLDDKARPIATQPPNEIGRDWKRPFVASEIGEALPHWEMALYLQDPGQMEESARALRRTLRFLIATALGAIACGGWLVFVDARRQMALAQQKTDFVSNVSHELKTPLTSIRMFAEMMQSGKGATAEKHPQYIRIIMVEAERLTRLINNVLDFARLERKQKRVDRKPLDLHEVIARTWEGHELHLRESGFTTRWTAAPPPYEVVGDDDALAQILVNLLSNAEKYSGDRKEVELHTYLDGGFVCVSVLDRGSGVAPEEKQKIFEAFYRAHDCLSSGIQGSGLGLTLAQRLAHEHDGEITLTQRDGGGSNFTLRIPLAKTHHS